MLKRVVVPAALAADFLAFTGMAQAAALKGKGNDIAAGTIPLIATTPGIRYLGPLPGDLQDYLTYTAVPLVSTRQREVAEDFIRFLTSSKATDTFAANGVD